MKTDALILALLDEAYSKMGGEPKFSETAV